jgi:myosin heavy subunit
MTKIDSEKVLWMIEDRMKAEHGAYDGSIKTKIIIETIVRVLNAALDEVETSIGDDLVEAVNRAKSARPAAAAPVLNTIIHDTIEMMDPVRQNSRADHAEAYRKIAALFGLTSGPPTVIIDTVVENRDSLVDLEAQMIVISTALAEVRHASPSTGLPTDTVEAVKFLCECWKNQKDTLDRLIKQQDQVHANKRGAENLVQRNTLLETEAKKNQQEILRLQRELTSARSRETVLEESLADSRDTIAVLRQQRCNARAAFAALGEED